MFAKYIYLGSFFYPIIVLNYNKLQRFEWLFHQPNLSRGQTVGAMILSPIMVFSLHYFIFTNKGKREFINDKLRLNFKSSEVLYFRYQIKYFLVSPG